MIYQNVILTAKEPAHIDTISTLLQAHADMSRAEPGCARFEVYQSNEDPAVFLLIEQWESPAALDAHRTAEAVQTLYFPKIIPLVDRVPHPSTRLSPA